MKPSLRYTSRGWFYRFQWSPDAWSIKFQAVYVGPYKTACDAMSALEQW